MTQVKVDATGETLDVSDDQLGVLAAKGGFSFPAGTQIPVRAADGSVSAVPVEQYWANQSQLNTASPEDVAAHVAKQASDAQDAQQAALDEQYGNGIANFARAHAEAGLRGATMGASDWLLSQLGADPTGMKERAARNPFTGASEMAGMVIPAVLTGGESAAAEGVAGVATSVARATPAALVNRIGEAVGAKVAARMGEGFTSQLAAGTARMVAEGALTGVGGEVSARALDDKAVLDPGAMDEYLMAAGQGALIGGAMGAIGTAAGYGLSKAGAKAAELGRTAVGKARGYIENTMQAGTKEAEAGLTAAQGEGDALLQSAKSVDYDANVRAATQRMDSLKAEDFGQTEAKSLKEKARAKLAANAPTTPVLTSAGGMPAHAPLDQIGAVVKKEAKALGVESSVADDSWSRIERGHEAYKNIDATHADTTKKVAGIVDQMEALRQDIDDTVGMARRNDSIREALATDRTAAPAEQFNSAVQMQHMRIRSAVQSFVNDDESKVRSLSKKLDEYLAGQEKDLAKLNPMDHAQRADALEILDQTNRVVGRFRDNMGEQVGVTGVKTFPDALSSLYEENRQFLKNPEIVGNRVSEIVGKQKGNWSDVLDVSRGYKNALLRTEAGGKRSISGFENAARGDTAKIAPLLKSIDDPANQLNLELIGRGIDTRAKLMQGFLDDLKLIGKSAEQVKQYTKLSRDLADTLVGYRSEQQLAKEFAANALPGLKEIEGLDAKIAAGNEKSAEKLSGARAKIQEQIDSERAKADALRAKGMEKAAAQKDALIEKAQAKLAAVKDKSAESVAGGIVEGLAPVLGAAFGGIGGFAVGQIAGKMATPVIRSIARNSLTGMLKAQEKATQYAAVHAIGARISKAAAAVVDRMHAAKPLEAAAKTIALRAPRNTREEFDRTMAWVDKAGPYDARAAYLKGIAPSMAQPTQLRADLDTTPPVHPLAMRKFLRAARAAQDPASAFEDLAKGVQSKEAGDVLTHLYPTLKNRAISQIMNGAAHMKVKPSMRSQQELSLFFGTPVHFTMNPTFVAGVQSTYEQANAAGQGSQDMLQEQGAGKPARQYNSKAGQMQATQTQRLEAGIT